jgi:hypothetical protein
LFPVENLGMTETYEDFKNGLKGRPNVPWATFWWVLFLCFTFFAFMQCHYWVAIGDSGRDFRRLESRLGYLARALQNYHDEHGSFPPPPATDEEANSKNSWRTLAEPYFSESSVRMFAVVEPQTEWPWKTSLSKAQITDGPENTIQLIELEPSELQQNEADDVHFNGTELTYRGKPIDWPQGVHIGYPYWFWQEPVPYTFVTFADGSVDRIPANVPREILLAALTPAGGEPNELSRYLTEHPVPVSEGPNELLLIGFPFLSATMFVLAFCYTLPRDGLRYTLFFSLGLALMMLPISGLFTPTVQGVQTSPGAVLFGALFWIVFGLTGGGCFYLYDRARQYIRWMNRRQSKDDGPRSQLEDTL